jgi:hypothetical protein
MLHIFSSTPFQRPLKIQLRHRIVKLIIVYKLIARIIFINSKVK